MKVMQQYRLMNYDKYLTLVGVVDNGGGCACVEAGSIWEVSTFLSNLL